MKNIFYLISLVFAIESMAGLPPTTAKGYFDATKLTTFFFEAPNYQFTKTSGSTGLVETGNTNILKNPGFEHEAATSSWTISGAATQTVETSVVIQGKKSIKFVTSGNTFSILQSSTLYQAQLADGVQGVASAWIKNTAPGVSICSRKAGSTHLCQTALTDGLWHLYKIPFVLGGTSNGIEVTSTSTTGDTYVDGMRVEVQDVIEPLPNNIPWTSYTPIFTGFGTVSGVNCRWRAQSQNLDINCTFTGGTATAVEARVSLPLTFVTQSTLPTLSVAGYWTYGGTTGSEHGGLMFREASVGYLTLSRASLFGNATIEPLSKALGTQLAGANVYSFFASVPVVGLSADINTYSQPCTSNIACTNTFSAKVSSTDVVSNENLDWINGNCTNAGAGLATCVFNSGIFSVAPNCNVTESSATDGRACNISAITSSQVDVVCLNSSWTQTNSDFNISCQKNTGDFIAKKQIVGSFKDVVSTQGITGGSPVLYSAVVGATGTVSNEFGDFISGNCTNPATGRNVCTLNTSAFTGSLNCSVTTTDENNTAAVETINCGMANKTSSSIEIVCKQGPTLINRLKEIICHGTR